MGLALGFSPSISASLRVGLAKAVQSISGLQPSRGVKPASSMEGGLNARRDPPPAPPETEVDGVKLDLIPFFGDAYILIDDLPQAPRAKETVAPDAPLTVETAPSSPETPLNPTKPATDHHKTKAAALAYERSRNLSLQDTSTQSDLSQSDAPEWASPQAY